MQVAAPPQSISTTQATRDQKVSTRPRQELITVYLGRQIYLKRVFVHGVDKGLWLHWCHPQDQGKQEPVKYGHFVPSRDALPDVLMSVRAMIEATMELEAQERASRKPASGFSLKRWLQRILF